MPRILKHLVVIILLVLIGGCASGGCGSGCASCGVTPLAEGFPPEQRVENSAAIRLTDSGVQFLNDNIGTLAATLLGGSVLTFEVPEQSGSALGIDYAICEGGANPNSDPPICVAEIDAGNAALQIATAYPHELQITGTLPIRLQDLPIHVTYFCVPLLGCLESTIDIVLNGNDACPGESQDPAQIGLDVDISVEVDTDPTHSYAGYSRIRIANLGVDEQKLEDSLHFCGSFDAGILESLKSIVFPLLVTPLLDTLKAQIDEQLCRKADPTLTPTCPSGTYDVGGVCRYGTADTDECASMVLGLDGHVDLGRLLASISPGTKGGLDFLLAGGGPSQRDDGMGYAWGDLDPIGGGATLGFYGGAEPQPVSGCVRLSDVAIPTGIPIPDELHNNTVPNWPADIAGPHFGFALSERFMNYALNGVYNSGLLCIGITTDTVALLNSGTIGLLAASLKDLGLQREQQPIAIVVRPGEPPKVTFGNGTDVNTDPLMRINLKNASFDFYMWSLDRYMRVMTATFDIDVPLNLAVTPEGLAPVLDQLNVTNGKVTNAGLLREDADGIASALGSLIASQVGQALGGGISPIDISSQLSSLGLTLEIPESVEGQGSPGLRKLSKGSDNFLGIFATLGVAGGAAMQADTQADLLGKEVDAEGLALLTMTKDNAPLARLHLSSPLDDGTRIVEYSYRVDSGFWHPFTRARFIDVRDDWMRVQGRHVIQVRARVAGDPNSLDPTPATVEVIVDAQAPSIQIAEAEMGQVKIDVSDLVSNADQAQVRVRFDGDTWSEWRSAADMKHIDVGEASSIEVEARDEEGNVGTAQQALIRGRAVADGSGCGCTTAGAPAGSNAPAFGLFGIALLGVLARIGRRQRKNEEGPVAKSGRARRLHGPAFAAITMAVASTWTGCSCGDEVTAPKAGDTCAEPTCHALEPGLVGAYTSVAVSGKDIWAAGYAEANWNDDLSWGDLVVGKWNGETIDWVAVDGVPAEPPVDGKAFNVNGFRGGQTSPGDDVGLWTSIAVDPTGNPAVAYYDRTHKALRFTQTADGKTWTTETVDSRPNGDVGRYAKLLFLGATPVIAYLAIEPAGGGAVQSSVRVATFAAGAWSFEDAVVDPATPCRKAFCDAGAECVIATGLCTATIASDQCGGKCATGSACVDQAGTIACADIYDKSKLDSYPEAVGDYVSIAPDGKGGFGIAYYDRIKGNLGIASKASGTWTSTIVDGQAADGADTGDMGIGASLAIDAAGDWHLAYVDGLDENVRYVKVSQGTTVGATEIVDDGLSFGGVKHDDGQHIVGDDAHLLVTPSGEVHITYQDATDGALRYAIGSPGATGHTWSVGGPEQEGFAGAFSSVVMVEGAVKLVNWWRVGGQEVKGDVAILSP